MDYDKVPDIITGKDLDYLKDMFNWNYGAYKNTIDAIDNISDSSLEKHLNVCADEFYEAMNDILTVLEEENNEDSK